MAKMLRDVYAPTKEGGTVLLKEGEDCPKEIEKQMVEKGYAEEPEKSSAKK
jgi:hypothetical protein